MAGDKKASVDLDIKVSRKGRQRQVTLVICEIANGYVLKAGGVHQHFDTIEALFESTAPATKNIFEKEPTDGK